MQAFTRNGSSEPGQPAISVFQPSSGRRRSGVQSPHRRNENGLLAIVERHRDEIRRNARLLQPADQDRG